MNLTIQDPEAYRLAEAIAQATGETIETVVTEALRERYDLLRPTRPRASLEELLAIASRVAAQVRRPYLDHAELLYDEHDLPK